MKKEKAEGKQQRNRIGEWEWKNERNKKQRDGQSLNASSCFHSSNTAKCYIQYACPKRKGSSWTQSTFLGYTAAMIYFRKCSPSVKLKQLLRWFLKSYNILPSVEIPFGVLAILQINCQYIKCTASLLRPYGVFLCLQNGLSQWQWYIYLQPPKTFIYGAEVSYLKDKIGGFSAFQKQHKTLIWPRPYQFKASKNDLVNVNETLSMANCLTFLGKH